ncbi:MAG: DNA gyrase subunit A, partial [Chloroflexi bacterium]|nr:DNA gyrase subunit A [Chloroflexota bacterium]
HILEGLKIALDQIDKVIATIRKSETAEKARQNLMTDFSLSQIQAQAILDMQLRRLANLERTKIFEEYAEVLKTIAYLEELLANPRRVLQLIKDEVGELKAKFGDPRRTAISDQGEVEFHEEDLIPHQSMVVTLSERGFVKGMPAQLYTSQHRGGKGIVGMITRENDAVRLLVVADTHASLLFFTNRGKVFRLKCYEVPAGSSRIAKGTAVINLFPIAEDERVTDVVAVTDFVSNAYLLMATRRGEVKKTALDQFASVRSSGLIAMVVETGDELVAARLAAEQDNVIVVTEKGQSIKFAVSNLRASLRTSGGVAGIRLGTADRVGSMDVAAPDASGSGVRTFKITEKTGNVAAARVVNQSQEVMIMSAEGIVIRTPVKERDPKKGITILSRSTQGVRLMKLGEGDKVVAITSFIPS